MGSDWTTLAGVFYNKNCENAKKSQIPENSACCAHNKFKASLEKTWFYTKSSFTQK